MQTYITRNSSLVCKNKGEEKKSRIYNALFKLIINYSKEITLRSVKVKEKKKYVKKQWTLKSINTVE